MEECLKEELTFQEKDEQNLLFEEGEINIYPVSELPIPGGIDAKEYEIIFLDPTIGEGRRLVNDKSTPIPHLFALLRQFIFPVCQNVGVITDHMIKRGVSVNDVDATTGMTMFHYAVRATALSESRGLATVKKLLSCGADPRQRCLYSGMNALHIAAYFDIPSVAKLLLKTCDLWPSVNVNSLCESFSFGTSLHIACNSLSSKVLEVLLQRGAWTHIKDDLGQTAIDCLPNKLTSESDHQLVNFIKSLLLKYKEDNFFSKFHSSNRPIALTIGSKVVCSMHKPAEIESSQVIRKTGILRFLGNLHGSNEEWAGIELFTPDGQNSGDFDGKVYFKCKKNHGVFVPVSLVNSVLDKDSNKQQQASESNKRKKESRSKLSHCKFMIGDRVLVAGKLEGTVRYVGETQFASGTWCGIELDVEGPGRNNGSVSDISYFKCEPMKGIFSPPSKLLLLQSAAAVQDQSKLSSDSSPRNDSLQENNTLSELNQTATDSSDLSLSLSSPRVERPSEDPEPIKCQSSKSQSSLTSSMKLSNEWDSSTVVKKSKAPVSKPFLHVGMRVGVRGMERKATVKFLGETDFSVGLWVGLDFGFPCGKNDGSVQGRRYFTCDSKHGLMIRPNRISYNGMSGNQLLPPQLKTSQPV